MAYYSKKQLLNGLRQQICCNGEKAKRALLLVYENQTREEQASNNTIEFNGVGFSSLDAEILSGIATFYKKSGFVTPRQLTIVKRLMPKYAGQILDSSIERGLIKQISPRKYTICK